MIQAKKFTLANGLRVIHVPMKDNPTAQVMVLVEVGSHFEQKKQSGISHFLEHMCFKGTERRSRPVDIVRELDQIGAEYNAFTGREYTGYWAKSQAAHFRTLMDIVSDVYLNSTLPEGEIKKEKGVVIEEINMYNDDPQSVVSDDFRTLMYGDQPAGWDIIGTRETVASFTREEILNYRKIHYVPESTILVVAGGVEEAELNSLANEYFGKMPKGEKGTKTKVVPPNKGVQVKLHTKKTDQTHVVLGFPTFDKYDNRRYALRVLRAVLRGGMSSRLFQRFRDELGMGYYINADYSHLTDMGTFSISTGIDVKRIEECVREIIAQIQSLRDTLVSDEELQKAKDYLSGRILLGLETSDDYADFYGFQELFSKEELRSPADAIARLKAVTAEEIQAIAKEYFTTENIHFAAIGPYDNEEEIKKYLRLS